MNQSIPSYMISLSNNTFEILEEIFERKYSKFIKLYWLLKDYSEYIDSFDYKNKSKEFDTLKISINFNNIADIDKILKELKKQVDDDDNITISKVKNNVNIVIIGDEVGLELDDSDKNEVGE